MRRSVAQLLIVSAVWIIHGTGGCWALNLKLFATANPYDDLMSGLMRLSFHLDRRRYNKKPRKLTLNLHFVYARALRGEKNFSASSQGVEGDRISFAVHFSCFVLLVWHFQTIRLKLLLTKIWSARSLRARCKVLTDHSEALKWFWRHCNSTNFQFFSQEWSFKVKFAVRVKSNSLICFSSLKPQTNYENIEQPELMGKEKLQRVSMFVSLIDAFTKSETSMAEISLQSTGKLMHLTIHSLSISWCKNSNSSHHFIFTSFDWFDLSVFRSRSMIDKQPAQDS